MQTYTIVHRIDDLSKEISDKLEAALKQANRIRNDENPEVVFVIGGDGTFLYAVHKYIDKIENLKFYGLHTGTLGFFTDYSDNEFDTFLEQFLTNDLSTISYPLLKVDTGKQIDYALNEMRIENVARTQVLHISVDDDFFEDFRGTGICIATQLGSTAYNRSLGGAVIVEGMDAIIMSEIAGIHHSKYRSLGAPIVMKGNTRVTLKSEDFSCAILGVDSEVYPLDGCKTILVETSDIKKVNLLRCRNISYFKRLKSLF